ncbi:Acetyltransferase (GNAT) family protein [Paracidovorax anthurii]|uniref:Acetyltransferase (GNAT) family protein n=2 Tax=Paracidovorax anthurii TaxID=78229 RepID=A0A328ZHS0_9BURK|nr:acetyltransferase (GNAT) family protein [Paracidovorax anthurii]
MMRWRNLVEPSSLMEHFQLHPSEGFTALDGVPVPAFMAPFDLLTTADEALRSRVLSWPMHRVWSAWLRVRTAFVGSPVMEYAPLPDVQERPRILAETLRQSVCDKFPLTILKDVPRESPLLSEADNAYARGLLDACTQLGFILVEGQALAYLPIDFDSLEGYLARLSSGRRANLRRKWRSRQRLEVRHVPTGDAFASDNLVDALYALYEGVYDRSHTRFERLTRGFFAAALRDAGSGGIVFEYRLAATGELLGWNLCYECSGRLVDKYIGFAYPAAREVDLYFVSWMVNLEYAIRRGLDCYVAGCAAPEIKKSLGAHFSMTCHAVYVRNSLLRLLARRFSRHFESDRRTLECAAPPRVRA